MPTKKPKIPDDAPRQLPRKADKNTKAVRNTFGGQHSLHGMFANTLEQVGGQDFINEWARNNPTLFMEMLLKLAPPPTPAGSGGGGSNRLELHIHPGLQAGALDRGLTIDA